MRGPPCLCVWGQKVPSGGNIKSQGKNKLKVLGKWKEEHDREVWEQEARQGSEEMGLKDR